MAKIFGFANECIRELKLVVWPSREQVAGSVRIVIVSVILVALILGALDIGFTNLFRLLMG